MITVDRYTDFKFGVINAIRESNLPKEAMFRSQNMHYKENDWLKVPGLEIINTSQLAAYPVWSVGKWHSLIPAQSKLLASCGTDLFAQQNDNTYVSVDDLVISGALIEYLNVPPFVYYGSQLTKWKRYDGGTLVYPVGGENGNASDAPRQFIKILFNPYAGRYFGIGDPNNPDYLNWSAHIDNEGIEKWPDGNVQIVDSLQGDKPTALDIYEGRVLILSGNSINSGSVVGVPENWSFQKERSQAGAYAGRTLKRYGSSFFMLTRDFEIYQWPNDKFITKGRVKFNINPHRAHLACAEIRDNRYYEITFESGEAVSSNKYHSWTYDILGDRWYGPHIQRNLTSMFYDQERNYLIGGGADDLDGYIYEMRGKNIKASPMKCRLTTGHNFQGDTRSDKRYTKFRMKVKQEGSNAGGTGQLEVTVNVDQWANNPQSQNLVLEDPANQNTADTNAVRDSMIRRAHIHELYGRGSSIQFDIKHEVLGGDLAISEFEVELYERTKKEARSA